MPHARQVSGFENVPFPRVTSRDFQGVSKLLLRDLGDGYRIFAS